MEAAVLDRSVKKTAKSKKSKEAIVRARIDPDLKEKTEKILKTVGLSSSSNSRLFLQQVALHRGLPFDVRIPNAKTVKALEAAERGEGTVYTDVNDLMAKYLR